MIRSRYTLFVDDYPTAGEHLFYNTRTQGLVVIGDELRDLIEGLPATAPQTADGPLAQLAELGFLTQDETQDRASLDEYFRDLKGDTSVLNATVLTTYACNFACTYCVEEGVTGAVHMDQETALASARYIAARARELGSTTIHLSLYGGEPLVNMAAVRTVMRETRRLALEAGVRYAASMTTNGALLTPPVVEELAGLGLVGVKVTLDGDRARHDRKRPFKDGRPTFDLIMRNIEYAAGKIDVDLGGNWDDANVGSFPALLDYLKARGLGGKLTRVSFKPIAETTADRDRSGARPSQELACVYGRAGTACQAVHLRREVLNRGFPADPGLGVQICGITLNGTQITIDPRGLLYRCPAFVGHSEFSTGSIRDGETTGVPDPGLWRRCADCAYVPLCGDGCMYSAYVRYGDAGRLNCQREYVEHVVRENLKSDYEDTEGPHRSTREAV